MTRFLRNRGSQFLFWGDRATRIEGSIPEESRFTIPFWGESSHLSFCPLLRFPSVSLRATFRKSGRPPTATDHPSLRRDGRNRRDPGAKKLGRRRFFPPTDSGLRRRVRLIRPCRSAARQLQVASGHKQRNIRKWKTNFPFASPSLFSRRV